MLSINWGEKKGMSKFHRIKHFKPHSVEQVNAFLKFQWRPHRYLRAVAANNFLKYWAATARIIHTFVLENSGCKEY